MSPIEAKALTCLKQAEELEGALQNYERAASPRLAKSLQGIGSFLTLLYATLGRPLTGAGRAELATKTTAKRDDAVQSLSWFFVGDLIDWLRDHDRVTGVGRATCELWLSTLQYQKSALFAPCVEAATALGLASVSPLETLRYVSSKVGGLSILETSGEPTPPAAIETISPARGDHVIFTGVVWTRHYSDLFLRLNAAGISFSVLVHDIIPIEEPDLASAQQRTEFIEWLKTTLTFARIVYVSGPHVRDQIIRWSVIAGYDIRTEIVIVDFGLSEFPAVTPPDTSSAQSLAQVDLDFFVLSVGTIDKRKNQILLCRLWARLAVDLGPARLPQLVLAGRDDLDLAASTENFATLIASGKIRILQGLSDPDLFALYRACLFTAFPSTSEGYGLPVAESFGVGKLCLAADLPAIRGHAGDLPWYFDPADAEHAYACLRTAIVDSAKRSEATQRIVDSYRPRGWSSTFNTMAEAVARCRYEVATPVRLPEGRREPAFLQPIPPTALAAAQRWCRFKDPTVSILLVNWNASEMTLECVRQIWAHSGGIPYEILIIDNGSAEESLASLRTLAGIDGVRLLELGCNRYFGEANNIAAEHATGRYICLLNNDAFPKPNWLSALVAAIEGNDDVGGVGPLFLFPNGRVQEAGAVVNAEGFPIRLARDNETIDLEAETAKFVDYISAAAFLLRRDVFMKVGGFDLTYEPAYYEDTDLCFKLHALGKKVLFCPEAVVVHIEGASTKDTAAALTARKMLGDLNRGKFVARWGSYLRRRDPAAARKVLAGTQKSADLVEAARPAPVKTAAVYTPFALTPGGGERYILTLAWALTEDFAVTIATPNPYSRLRLRALGLEFGLDLSRCEIATLDTLRARPRPDLMVTMGNHVVPPTEAIGQHALYMCQFPFPLPLEEINKGKTLLDGYDRFLVNSDYSKAYVFIGLNLNRLPPRPIEVLYPPVPQLAGRAQDKKDIILSVGRFFEGGHNKRHDLMIEAFKALSRRSPKKLELHLVGSSIPQPNQMAYLGKLQKMADGLDVFFHVNASPQELAELYRVAAVYWHATGLNVDLKVHPDAAEHFGISIVEAMSAACVPLALNCGGPREIIEHGKNGFLYGSIEELVQLSEELFKDDYVMRRIEIGEAACLRAADFTVAQFASNVRRLAAIVMN